MNSLQPEDSPQDQGQKTSPQQIFLIGLLGVVFIIIIIVSIIILTRPKPESPVPSPAQAVVVSPEIIASQSPTVTLTPTPRLTFTPKPTQTGTVRPTSSPSPSPTLLPSLTPEFPSEFNDQYELADWTPQLADQLIELLEVYPDTLSSFARGDDDQKYFDAFQYALFAQREALLLFPTAQEADQWQWQLAYNLARTGDQNAGQVYASLITQELNRGNISLDELYLWGLEQIPELVIETFPINHGNDLQSSNLIKITAGENGSSYSWLVERSTGYSAYSLTDDFDFVKPNQIDNFAVELLGSNSNVVGIFPENIYDSQQYTFPNLFSLHQQPPQELPFEVNSPPAIGPDFKNYWQPVEAGSEPGELKFSDIVFPACPVTVEHFYTWNGSAFSFVEARYSINPDPSLLSYCEIVINHSINVWGVETTIDLMETLLPDWPPEATITGKEYPEDALDEWRYRLAIYHALLGNQDQANEYALLIVNEPASPDSQWVEPASAFLETYQDQMDIYWICLQSQFCDPQLGFQSLIKSMTPQDYPDLINVLEQAGVAVRSHGYFDFNNDGETEQWVIIRHQSGSPLEFWIVSSSGSELHPVFVDSVENFDPRISYLEPLIEPPIVLLEPDITFQYFQINPESEPVIVMVDPVIIFSSDRTEMELNHLEEILLTGGDPKFVQDELIILGSSPYFTCSYLLCPRYLYLLGLSYQLADDEYSAIATYLDLWRRYPGHPFTIMARSKLVSTFIPTPTMTPSITTTQSAEEPATPIPAATSTPEGYPPPGYPPPESTPTSTAPGYPYPNP